MPGAQMTRSRLRMRGFGLIEWLVTLALAFGLVALALGPWRRWWLGVALVRTEYALLASLSMARHEAVRRNQPVGLCRADAQGACADKTLRDQAGRAVPPEDWRFGWLVVTDRVGRRSRQAAMRFDARPAHDAPLVLHRVAALPGVRMQAYRGAERMVFRPPLGQVVGRWGRFVIQAEDAAARGGGKGPLAPRCIWLSGGGRARVSQEACR